MGDYIQESVILKIVSEAMAVKDLALVPGKRILYRGTNDAGETVLLCMPRAKRQDRGFYWVDLTAKQVDLLSEAAQACVVFRLEGRCLLLTRWETLRAHLTTSCMRYSHREGEHWKLHLYPDRIEVCGGSSIVEGLAFYRAGDAQ